MVLQVILKILDEISPSASSIRDLDKRLPPGLCDEQVQLQSQV